MTGAGKWAGWAVLLWAAGCNLKPVEPELSLTERAQPRAGEVASPSVYKAAGLGFWDGRPALGGIWIARPDAGKERRVLVTVAGQKRSAAAALYPNPTLDSRFQVSSDLAEVLGITAGRTVMLEVVALQPGRAPAASTAERSAPSSRTTPAVKPASVAVSGAAVGAGAGERARSAVQTGVFAEQGNAEAAAARIRSAGMEARVAASGRLWRVIALSGDAPATLLAKVKELGFADAYAVAL